MKLFASLFLVSVVGLVGCSTAVVDAGGNEPKQTVESDASVSSTKADVTNPQGTDTSIAQKTDTSSTTKPPQQNGCVSITIYHDADGDGYGDNETAIQHCKDQPFASDWTTQGGDCNDNDLNVFPNIFEILIDGKDNDCDGKIDNVEPYSCSNCKPSSHCVDPDKDGIGYCENNVCNKAACSAIDGYCDNDNVCTPWCTIGSDDCGPNENCIDTNGNGLGDKCVPNPNAPSGATSPKGVCVGTNLFVPYNCKTIQDAVNALPQSSACLSNPDVYDTITVQTGTYDESVIVENHRHVMIKAYDSLSVIVNGGLEHAFEVRECSSLAIKQLVVKNDQDIKNSSWPSTIFVNLGGAVSVYYSTIYTKSIAVSTGYAWWTRIMHSTIIGEGVHETVGLDLEFESESLNNGMGPHVYDNTFKNLSTAIFWCVGSGIPLSETGGDSNTYQNVTTLMSGSSNLMTCGQLLNW